MADRKYDNIRTRTLLCGLLTVAMAIESALGQPAPAAVSGFVSYASAVESRLDRQHRSCDTFIAPMESPQLSETRLDQGELAVEQLTPSGGTVLPGARLQHWRGTAFIIGAKAAGFERLMENFNTYPQHFSPQILRARVLSQDGDRFQVRLRASQRHVITVVMDTDYDIVFRRLDPEHGYSISRSTKISEIDSPGSVNEPVLSPSREHGFLWRLNTYWSYEERNGGLYIQIETISLSRSIPLGLGWIVGPFVESVPRESMEFTLRSTCNAMRNSFKRDAQ